MFPQFNGTAEETATEFREKVMSAYKSIKG